MAQSDFDVANARAAEFQKSEPRALAAWYERHQGMVVVELNSGLKISFASAGRPELAGSPPDDLTEIEISPSGFGLHFPKIDADLYLPALVEEISRARDS